MKRTLHNVSILGSGLLLLTGCGAPSAEGVRYADPPPFEGFPYSATGSLEEGKIIVYAEAQLVVNAERELGEDLVEERGVLPIKLSIQLKGEGQQTLPVSLDRDRWNMRLYLPDGQVLHPVPVDQVERGLKREARERIRRAHFEAILLGSTASEGYLFFALQPRGELLVRGAGVIRDSGGIAKPMRIADSLLAFNVTVEDKVHPFYLGLRR